MESKNIITKLLESGNESGRALALITPDSERTFATFLGAAVELSAEDIPVDLFNGYAIFHVEGYLVQNRKLIEDALKMAKEAGCLISLDLASYNVVEENREFLHHVTAKYVDILFANEEEAKAFTMAHDEDSTISHMAGLCDIVILKKGVNGSIIRNNNSVVKVDVVKANSIYMQPGFYMDTSMVYRLINAVRLVLLWLPE